MLRIAGLAAQPGLVHGFSTMALGDMRAGPNGRALTAPRLAFAEALGVEPSRLVIAEAVHGAEVARVDEPAGAVPGVDVLITDRPGLALAATFADCYPVVLYDPQRRALALAHAGWRGSLAGVAARAGHALCREYGSQPETLIAGLGPGICGHCYEVSEEIARRFDRRHSFPSGRGRFHVDLAAVNRDQLLALGVPHDSLHQHGACTREHPELPSHRRSPDGARFLCIAAIT